MIGFLLSLLALVLFVVIAPFGLVYQVVTDFRGANKYFFKLAICIDQAGNVACSGLFNLVFKKSEGHRFGNEDETISSVIGKNHKSGTLTWCGRLLYKTLDKIQKNHAENAIEVDELRIKK